MRKFPSVLLLHGAQLCAKRELSSSYPITEMPSCEGFCNTHFEWLEGKKCEKCHNLELPNVSQHGTVAISHNYVH